MSQILAQLAHRKKPSYVDKMRDKCSLNHHPWQTTPSAQICSFSSHINTTDRLPNQLNSINVSSIRLHLPVDSAIACQTRKFYQPLTSSFQSSRVPQGISGLSGAGSWTSPTTYQTPSWALCPLDPQTHWGSCRRVWQSDWPNWRYPAALWELLS